MKKLFEKKINIVLIVVLLVLIAVTIIAFIIWKQTSASLKKDVSYDDKLNTKNYFENIAINFDVKRTKRDGADTTLKEEFGISEEEEAYILSSKENLREFLSGSTYEIARQDNNIVYIKNDYQTKKIIVICNEKIDKNNSFNAKDIRQMPSGTYIIEYDTKKRAQAAEEYFSAKNGYKVLKDEISFMVQISDESQTMYGENHDDLPEGVNSRAVIDMGLDNFKKIINENGNPSEVIVSTIGYGIQQNHSFFDGRISDKYYNFIDNKKDISETISQGSRIAEVIVDSTASNVKILPIKIVNEQGCTSLSAIINAIEYATRYSDILCYELVNNQNDAIDKALKNAYKEEKPVCAVTTKGNSVYPASHETTISTSSVNKNFEITTYSGAGTFVDFAASSTDIKEIFNAGATVSRWSGVQYSNAAIVAEIALLKTYNKDMKIEDIYKELIKYCKDYGTTGKDESYGYGVPKFGAIQISDLDKVKPEMQDITVDNEKWEKSKNIKISAKDNIRILGWQVTESADIPQEWNNVEGTSATLEAGYEISKNGKYFVWVKDSATNSVNKEIEVSKVDNTAPDISYTINKDKQYTEGIVTINIQATDEESGLAEAPYSWDNSSWGKENNYLNVNNNGRYTIYCKDNVGNVSSKEIEIDSFAVKAEAIIDPGNVIKAVNPSSAWDNNTNLDVQVILKNTIDIVAWQITTANVEPSGYVLLRKNEDINNNQNNVNSQNSTNTNSISSTLNTNPISNQNRINTSNTSNSSNNSINSSNTLNIPQSSNSQFNASNSHIAITANFEAGTTYYVWVIDSRGSKHSQSFRIEKVKW